MGEENILLVKDKRRAEVKHSALTGFLRHNWTRGTKRLKQIVYNCDVQPYLGALPPELRSILPKNKIASVTQQFRESLEDFLITNGFEIHDMDADKVYEFSSVGELFNTKCFLETKGINAYGVNPWGGAVGFVCKLSFPEINAHYALKLFYKKPASWAHYSHGPWFEIATAFAANNAQPHDNNPVYMASLKYDMYMLSKWAGDKQDGIPGRDKLYSIFETSLQENGVRNRRGGRIIDWGETFLTGYGRLSYPARKLVRQFIVGDKQAMQKTLDKYKKNHVDSNQMCQAIEYIHDNLMHKHR